MKHLFYKLFALLPALLIATAVWSQPVAPAPAQRYAVVAFHDVVDKTQDLDGDAITTDRLVAFFDWLRGNGWNAVSLDDIARAGRGEKPLPPKAILITFDDGYRSLYTHVYPLALAYKIPVVAALVGAWVDTPPGSTVHYDNKDVPRSHFISWDEAREMQRSGLIEFASHSYALHEGILANPQGNQLPAAMARAWSPGNTAMTAMGSIESEADFFQRIKADLEKSRSLHRKELGREPRALVWPFGRYTETGAAAAIATGFSFALTLEPAPADLTRPMAVARYLPTNNPKLGELVANIQFAGSLPAAQRLVCVNPAALWNADAQVFDDQLGKAIERLRKLGATTVVLDATVRNAQGQIEAAWFPNSQLPMKANALSRIAWQMHTRAGVDVVARLPHRVARARLGSTGNVLTLFREMSLNVPLDGLLLENAVLSGATDSADAALAITPTPWQTAQARRALTLADMPPDDALAIQAFRAASAGNSALRLVWLAGQGAASHTPSTLADLTLFDRSAFPDTLATSQLRRTGLWMEGSTPPENAQLLTATTAFQRRGGTAFGWCPDDVLADQPEALKVAPGVSAATFPVRF